MVMYGVPTISETKRNSSKMLLYHRVLNWFAVGKILLTPVDNENLKKIST